MANFSITPDEVLKARGATFLTDLDMAISPNGGHLVPVAMNHGVHVCWGCGEQFDGSKPQKRMVEMRPKDSVIPVGMHAGCVGRKPRVSVVDTLRGFEFRRTMAKYAAPLANIEQEIKNRIFGTLETAAPAAVEPVVEAPVAESVELEPAETSSTKAD